LFSTRKADCFLEAKRISGHDDFMFRIRHLFLLALFLWPLCSHGESMNDALAVNVACLSIPLEACSAMGKQAGVL